MPLDNARLVWSSSIDVPEWWLLSARGELAERGFWFVKLNVPDYRILVAVGVRDRHTPTAPVYNNPDAAIEVFENRMLQIDVPADTDCWPATRLVALPDDFKVYAIRCLSSGYSLQLIVKQKPFFTNAWVYAGALNREPFVTFKHPVSVDSIAVRRVGGVVGKAPFQVRLFYAREELT